jgi:hypothetical protein
MALDCQIEFALAIRFFESGMEETTSFNAALEGRKIQSQSTGFPKRETTSFNVVLVANKGSATAKHNFQNVSGILPWEQAFNSELRRFSLVLRVLASY